MVSPDREQDAITMAALATVTVKTMMAPNIFRMAISFLWMGGRLAGCARLAGSMPQPFRSASGVNTQMITTICVASVKIS